LIRLSFILGKIRGTLPPNIFLLPVKHLRPGTFHDKAQAAKRRRGLQRLGAIERKLKTDTRRVEASSRGRERGGGQSAPSRRSHGENIFHAPSQPNSNDPQTTISVLSLFRSWVTALQASWYSLILDGHSSCQFSLYAGLKQQVQLHRQFSPLQKLVLSECLTSSGYATLIIPPTYRSPRAS